MGCCLSSNVADGSSDSDSRDGKRRRARRRRKNKRYLKTSSCSQRCRRILCCCCPCAACCGDNADADTEAPLDRSELRPLSSDGGGSSYYGPLVRQVSMRTLEMFAWQELHHARKKKFYYFSVLSGETTWEKPVGFDEHRAKRTAVARLEDMQQGVALCAEYGCALRLHGGGLVDDVTYKNKITGTTPMLADCLFYQAFLIPELHLYPQEFITATGLKQLVLVDNLKYKQQPRKAVPSWRCGILYLDPKPEALYYLQDVFHHEFFHIIDVMMRKHAEPDERRREKIGFYTKDPVWCGFNVAGFRYGTGGANMREDTAFISGDTDEDSVVLGFLNRYSMSAIEEDKAEVWAAMIRYPPAMFMSKDDILRKKAWELRRRVQTFCPALDDEFWDGVTHNNNSSRCTRILQSVDPTEWTVRVSKNGKQFWHNKRTNQRSWLNPELFERDYYDLQDGKWNCDPYTGVTADDVAAASSATAAAAAAANGDNHSVRGRSGSGSGSGSGHVVIDVAPRRGRDREHRRADDVAKLPTTLPTASEDLSLGLPSPPLPTAAELAATDGQPLRRVNPLPLPMQV